MAEDIYKYVATKLNWTSILMAFASTSYWPNVKHTHCISPLYIIVWNTAIAELCVLSFQILSNHWICVLFKQILPFAHGSLWAGRVVGISLGTWWIVLKNRSRGVNNDVVPGAENQSAETWWVNCLNRVPLSVSHWCPLLFQRLKRKNGNQSGTIASKV